MKESIAHSVANDQFCLEWHYTTGQVESLHRVQVSPQFQWIRGRFGLPIGMCYLDKRYAIEQGIGHVYEYMNDLRLVVERRLTPQGYVEHYCWANVGKTPIDIQADEVGVYVTFAEKYDIEQVTSPYRAYTHIMCAQGAFYMANTRCNGQSDGVGLVVTQGHVASVGAERLDPRQRGDLIAYLPPCRLLPGQSVDWQWLVFGYDTLQRFWQVVGRYAPKLQVSPRYPTAGQQVCVRVNDKPVPTVLLDGAVVANPFVCPVHAFWLTLPDEQNVPYVGDTFASSTQDEDQKCRSDAAVPEDTADNTPEQSANADAEVARSFSIPIGWYIQPCTHAQLWASCYRAPGRGANPRQQLVLCDNALQQFVQSQSDGAPDYEVYQNAVVALLRYYRQGGMRRVDACLPQSLLAADDQLRAYFAKQLRHALARKKALFGAQYVLAMADMTRIGQALGFDCADRYNHFAQYAELLLHTPFGELIV